ncbi:Phosphatidylinositol 4,5-bisphosphate 3-kinase catalytic subunit delta isoform [Eumeta japonica]|uniref:Phosphatidylinositol 4,5-bisphosphate 3-kinase catalytic subunit delta isoform n=1 Tax=Eumeta variegata TaxID=151549 RepID=A0A4C1UJ12_EUMVA|nr:Phosphatidylinositol 4,5-bisphosphate 3-kinase catalytic subunit delta isoform [Eumeta japonica]
MVPKPSFPFTWDYWTSPSDSVELTCLLPNSCFIALSASLDATLQDVKLELWNKATRHPFHGMLQDMSLYVFQFINSLASLEEVDDEEKRLRDVKPVLGVLKIVERCTDQAGEHLLNSQISHLIGKGLNEFDALRTSEVNDFRMHMRILTEESVLRRARSSIEEKLRHRYPPRLANQSGVPPTLVKRLTSNNFIIHTKVDDTEVG